MSDAVTLALRAPLDGSLDVEGLTADRCARLSEREIAALPAWLGSRQVRIGDCFAVRGGGAARLRIEGDLRRVRGIGAGTAAGELIVDGHAGDRVAAGMTGGRVEVRGDVGDDAAQAMAGGTLRVRGRAGHRLGAPTPGGARGMTGGEVVVDGAAGHETGARVRRGLIVVGGEVGDAAGRDMIAGTLVAGGPIGRHPGRGNKRGSIVALDAVAVPETYRYACTFEPPHVRLLMVYLHRTYGLAVERAAAARYRRYCGDAGEPGRGEILAIAEAGSWR